MVYKTFFGKKKSKNPTKSKITSRTCFQLCSRTWEPARAECNRSLLGLPRLPKGRTSFPRLPLSWSVAVGSGFPRRTHPPSSWRRVMGLQVPAFRSLHFCFHLVEEIECLLVTSPSSLAQTHCTGIYRKLAKKKKKTQGCR